MKKYSSKQAKRGRTAYRTPSRFIYKKFLENTERNRSSFSRAEKLTNNTHALK